MSKSILKQYELQFHAEIIFLTKMLFSTYDKNIMVFECLLAIFLSEKP